MCAIFGFIGSRKRGPNLRTLRDVVRGNICRGEHAFGFAWIDARGRLCQYRQRGRLTDELSLLAMLADARVVVGHLRWATHGNPGDNINNHPHPCDGGWLVHNGVVGNYRELVEAHDLPINSVCDSEVIGLLAERSDAPTLVGRLIDAVEQIDAYSSTAVLAVWKRPARLVAVKRGNPLHTAAAEEGVYLASLSAGLPGTARPVADDRAVVFNLNPEGEVHASVYPVASFRGRSSARYGSRATDPAGRCVDPRLIGE